MDILGNIVYFLIAIVLLILIHELGHFIVARLCGVYVERFSLGFGPVIYSYKGSNGTEYSLSLLPLGGYVKMYGESVDSEQVLISEENKKKSFSHKRVWQRFLIVGAGPFFNIVLAWILYSIVFCYGIDAAKPIVNVEVNSVAQKAGFKTNDQIVSINNVNVSDWEETLYELIGHSGEKSVEVQVKGNLGKDSLRNIILPLDAFSIDPEKQDVLKDLGLDVKYVEVYDEIGHVEKNSPAEKASLEVGDKIKSYNAINYTTWNEFTSYIKTHPNEEIFLEVYKDNDDVNAIIKTLVPELREVSDKEIGFAGIAPKVKRIEEVYFTKQYPFGEAIIKGAQKTGHMSCVTLNFITKFITGDISHKNVSGPIGIAKGAGMTARISFVVYLSFLALISVNLGVLNLLPVPVLDGGHLLFYIVEAIRGKPLSEKLMNVLLKIGMFLLLMLMSLSIFNDIVFNI